MKVIIDSNIRISEVPENILKVIKQELTMDNPNYAKKLKMGIPVYGEPKVIKLWSEKEVNGRKEYILPRGYYSKLWAQWGNLINSYDSRLLLPNVSFPSKPVLRDYQSPCIDAARNYQSGVPIMPCGAGKGHPLDTKIYTPNGYTTIGELKIGDKVIGSDGKSINITGIFDRGFLPTYRVNFSDNTSLLCDGDHIFTVQSQCQRTDKTNNWCNKTVRELMRSKLYCGIDKKHNRSKWYIPIVRPVEFEAKKVIIDPYFLGVWLGDGCSKGGHLHITNAETDIIEKIKLSVNLSQYEYNEYGVINALEIEREIERLGLMNKESHQKFIPDIYKYNSINIRVAVLRGLTDSDGSVDKTSYSITTTSKKMAYDMLEIVQSLGGTGKISERQTFFTNYGYKKPGMKSYRLHFKLIDILPFSSKKHNNKYVPRTKYKKIYRNIKSIEYIGEMEIRCISVDAQDKLYVAENFIVTHNTETALGIVAELKQPTLWITHTMDLLNQSMDRAKTRLGLTGNQIGIIQGQCCTIGSHITFATVQTLSKRDLSNIVNKFGCVIIDEAHLVFKDAAKARMFESVISQFPAFYRFGLTASEYRGDGLINTMFHIIGPKIYEIEQNDKRLPTVTPIVEFIETRFDYTPPAFEMFNVQKMLGAMRTDEPRYRPVMDVLSNKISDSDYTLVLGESLAYLEYLRNLVIHSTGRKAAFVCGDTPKKEREKIMFDMREGRYQYLFATYQLAKLGLDIPRLNKLVLATPKRDKTSIQQAVGRIMRPFEGKGQPVVYDIYDSNITQLRYWARDRVRVYQNLGCQINGGPKVRNI